MTAIARVLSSSVVRGRTPPAAAPEAGARGVDRERRRSRSRRRTPWTRPLTHPRSASTYTAASATVATRRPHERRRRAARRTSRRRSTSRSSTVADRRGPRRSAGRSVGRWRVGRPLHEHPGRDGRSGGVLIADLSSDSSTCQHAGHSTPSPLTDPERRELGSTSRRVSRAATTSRWAGTGRTTRQRRSAAASAVARPRPRALRDRRASIPRRRRRRAAPRAARRQHRAAARSPSSGQQDRAASPSMRRAGCRRLTTRTSRRAGSRGWPSRTSASRPRIRLTITIRVAATIRGQRSRREVGQTVRDAARTMPRLRRRDQHETDRLQGSPAVTNRNRAQRRDWSRPLRSPLAAAGWPEALASVGSGAGSVARRRSRRVVGDASRPGVSAPRRSARRSASRGARHAGARSGSSRRRCRR